MGELREIEYLLAKRWILKTEDREKYYIVRDKIEDIRKFSAEKLGAAIIENQYLVKIEKIPEYPTEEMGITEFSSKEEYAMFCILLMFLEDREDGEQFVLSALTEYIEGQNSLMKVDWKSYTSRRRLIKVLRYAQKQGILSVTDGNDSDFMEEVGGEVLYENTGISRYFMVNFPFDLRLIEEPSEIFENHGDEEDRGIVRRHRVYRRLLYSPAMYKNSGNEEDFEYLKNYGRNVKDELEKNFDVRVHMHRGSAYLIAGDDCNMGKKFPSAKSCDDIILLVNRVIQEKIKEGELKVQKDETVTIEEIDFDRLLRNIKEIYGGGFAKIYRDMPSGEFSEEIKREMKSKAFIKQERKGEIIILPLCGKISGDFSENFKKEIKK